MNRIETDLPETPSQMLIRLLEEFGNDEPTDIIVVWTTTEKNVNVDSTARTTTAVGMLEYAGHRIRKIAWD